MARQLELSDEGAEAFVAAMLKNCIENLTFELNDERDWHHPEDRKQRKKDLKALKRVYEYYSVMPYGSE